MLTWAFAARVREEGPGDWLVTFDDLPEAITGAATHEEALANAADALEEVVLAYLVSGLQVPDPRPPGFGETAIVLDAATASRALLARELSIQGMSYAELAQRIHRSEAMARNLVQGPRRANLNALWAALRSLGTTLAIAS